MSISRTWTVWPALFVLAVMPAVASDGPGLGEPLSADEVAAADYVVLPDGDGLPEGSGNAEAGEVLYRTHCIACHGENGQDGINDALAGGHGSIDSDRPVKTLGSYWPYATTVFDYLRRAMPYQQPGILSNDELYALTAYLLFINDIVERDTVLNRTTLPQVEMPNRQGFVWAWDPGE